MTASFFQFSMTWLEVNMLTFPMKVYEGQWRRIYKGTSSQILKSQFLNINRENINLNIFQCVQESKPRTGHTRLR